MPIYEYHCGKCGDFEIMQKISDKPLSTCPTCRRKVTKLISSTSFQLKGSGWYITDYARKSGSGPGDAKTATKSEEKSATSTEKPSGDAKPKDASKKSGSAKAAAA